MPLNERYEIVSALKYVDNCILFNDEDDTAIEAIRNVIMLYPFDRIIFANGGDRKEGGVPEDVLEEELGINMVYNVGGKKTQSSSKLIEKSKVRNV